MLFSNVMSLSRAVGKEGAGGRQPPPPPPPPLPPFPGAKYFFPRKIGKHKMFTCEEHMRLECIY